VPLNRSARLANGRREEIRVRIAPADDPFASEIPFSSEKSPPGKSKKYPQPLGNRYIERVDRGRNRLAYLSRIIIYPVKSLEPVSVEQARVLASGALEGDRAFALFDAADKFVNGKNNSRIHLLRSSYDPMTRTLQIGAAGSGELRSFQIDRERDDLQTWLTEYFGKPVFFRENNKVGFPDDLDCPGPTLISKATLAEVASWFPPLDEHQLRVRLRANLELAGVPAFWEDRLYTTKGSLVRFRIGDLAIDGNNPCQRCVVPPRDPATGEGYPAFGKIFAERRQQTLPPWAEKSRFNHFYRLAVNTIVPATEAGKIVRVGDEVEVAQPEIAAR
jgi:uncharacterized protein YcbX